jgi:hypothetical protein
MPRWRRFLQEWGLLLGLLVVLAGGFLLLRTSPSSLQTWADLETHLGIGEPVLIELYSNT